MLGQGLDTVIVITTNEPITALHPAATRAGRCWAEVAFEAFRAEEAQRRGWSRREASGGSLATTLAELYGLRDGRAARDGRRSGSRRRPPSVPPTQCR